MKIETAMKIKEKPIIFSTEMIKAILNGNKTMTRRIAKEPIQISENTQFFNLAGCKYSSGDILWVRETLHPYCYMDAMKPLGKRLTQEIEYKEDYIRNNSGNEFDVKWSSPFFMLKKYARIFLRVINIGIEKLQEISEEDAIKEGVSPLFSYDEIHNPRYSFELDLDPMPYKNYLYPKFEPYSDKKTAKESFRTLWDSINGKRQGCDWNSNPYVYIIEFKMEELKKS